MTKSFSDLIREDRRLVILRLLLESPDYRANHYLLQSALEGFGHTVSTDALRGELAWLAEQGAVCLEHVAHVEIARLTERGGDIAAGRAVVPGIKRPVPGE